MPRYLCTMSCQISQSYYKQGDVYELPSNPNAAYFAAFGDDIKREILGGFQRDLDGTLYLPGGGWDDLTFPVNGLNLLGAASDPTKSTTDGLLEFSATLVNTVAGVAHMPHRRQLGTKIIPHIHWYPADTNAGNTVWKFEYKIALVDAPIPGAYTTDTVTVAAPAAINHSLAAFSPIPVPDTVLGTIVMWRLSRLGNDAADTYASVARLMEFDIHFWQDSIGSGQEYSK